MHVQDVPVARLSLERFRPLLGDEALAELLALAARAAEVFAGRAIWSINSTARGGGVAEMLASLLAYARGAGVDARWAVIEGDERFFTITKRVHNLLHGSPGDGGPLGPSERAHYEEVLAASHADLAGRVRPGDVVLLHDPQTIGLVRPLRHDGALAIWRCHVGVDSPGPNALRAREFLAHYLDGAEGVVFSRRAHAWAGLDRRVTIVPPSIDPFAPKNQDLSDDAVAAILGATGIVESAGRGADAAVFVRSDDTPGRVDRTARVAGGPLPAGAPIVTQVSRWDALKDPEGVIEGFARHIASQAPDARLVLAGPDVEAVDDDPEGAAVLRACEARRERLEPAVRDRVHLAALPMEDVEENAAIVNALQRHSTVVVQKSLAEGFGLTVAEAMWKARPVVASRVGGIQDQVTDGESGLLVDPRDLEGFGAAVVGLLADPDRAEAIARGGRDRVRHRYLGPRHLIQYLQLFRRVLAASGEEPGT